MLEICVLMVENPTAKIPAQDHSGKEKPAWSLSPPGQDIVGFPA